MTNAKRAGILFIVVLFLAVTFGGVATIFLNSGDDENSQQAINDQTEQLNQQEGEVLQGTKLADFEPRDTVSELETIDIEEGTGEEVQAGASVTAHYTGALASDGTIFQSSYDIGEPVPFSLDGVIEGWTEGVPGMKVGGKRRLIIPAEKAYGAQSPSPDIPANSDLVFDITLVAAE